MRRAVENRKLQSAVLFMVLALLFAASAPIALAASGGSVYTDDEMGITFTIPEGWDEIPLAEKNDTIKAEFLSRDGNGVFTYGNSDVASALGISRSELDDFELDAEEFLERAVGIDMEAENITLNGNVFVKSRIKQGQEIEGTILGTDVVMYLSLENGYAHLFYFYGEEDSVYYRDFERVLESVEYERTDVYLNSSSTQQDTNSTSTNMESLIYKGGFAIGYVIGAFMFMTVIYTIPILIIRFVIRRKPVEPQSAKLVVIVYGICAVALLTYLVPESFITDAIAAVLCSIINYRILKAGYATQRKAQTVSFPVQPLFTDAPAPGIHYCPRCGNRVTPGSVFCGKCGARLSRPEK